MRIGTVAQCAALGLLSMAAPVVSKAQIGIGISIRIAPPVLPVYVQPACPVEGYLWTPGYWAYGPQGYYWVPGVWVAPPRPGVLWTPGYWGLVGGVYGWNAGYWGPHIGFYGGVNYGFGYGGVGFFGGAWAGNVFRYNTAVLNVNTTVVHNVYVDRTVIRNTTVINHASFNGPGGVIAQPRPEERLAAREQHIAPTSNQLSHEHSASLNRQQLASVNGGHPAAAAMDRPGGRQFGERGPAVAAARPAGPAPRPNSPPAQHTNAEHPNARPAQPQQAHATAAKPAAEHNRPAAEHGKPQKSGKNGHEK
jgi:hypothetical protein